MERSFAGAIALVGRATGPVSQHLGSFVDLLIRQQFVAAVVHVKTLHAMAFDRWLAKHDVDPAALSEAHIRRFARRRRRQRGPIRPETRRREVYDVQQVVDFLRSRGVCAESIASTTPVEVLVAAFASHLRDQQGLASPTIERYTIATRQFLENRFSTGAVDLHTLAARDIVEFIRGQVAHLTPPGLKCVVTAMRSFLRFAQCRGEVACELVAAVPAVATWATTPALPRAISPDHAQRAIDSCDLGTATGLRDRAILMILARLGLRANEVISLQLDDCDWNGGQVRVHSKGGRECLLPMPDDVGGAIAAYLERGRPSSDDRHLFLRSTAPISGFMRGSDAIGSIVKYALARAGANSPHRGSHQFRHALAVRMLRGGASLAEIGEVLRHRSPQTTSIYARVDIDALRPLALPWPGGAQ